MDIITAPIVVDGIAQPFRWFMDQNGNFTAGATFAPGATISLTGEWDAAQEWDRAMPDLANGYYSTLTCSVWVQGTMLATCQRGAIEIDMEWENSETCGAYAAAAADLIARALDSARDSLRRLMDASAAVLAPLTTRLGE